jgi:class 3 adenylate cyclase
LRSKEIVDINLDFQTRRQRSKRRFWRVIAPIGAVVLIVVSIASVSMVVYQNNRRDALKLTQDLLLALDRRIHSELSAYLLPASNLVEIGAESARQHINEIWSPGRTPVGLQVIKIYPQLSNFFGADPQGNFVMHRQNPNGTIDTKVIERKPSDVKVTWVYRDNEFRVSKLEISGDDGYDPRVRPWYVGAVESRRIHWSKVYIFFTGKRPGVTVSYPLYGADGELIAVMGIDIHLEQISQFLADLKIGTNGRAMIIEDSGTLVAYPQLDRAYKRAGETLVTVMLNELEDPVLTRAFNRFKIDGHGLRTLVVDDRRYLNTITSLKSTVGRAWSVMIVVPEDDFIAFLRDDLRKVFLMAAIIVIIAGTLAVLMVYQGLRADRNAALVLERKQEIEAQSRAFSELASKTNLWDPDDIESLEALTEIVSATMAVRRAGAWGYYEEQHILKCEDSFDQGTNGHTRGTVLHLDDYPQLLEDFLKGEDLVIADTAADPRTSDLHRVYFEPLGSASLLAIPVMPGGRLVGAIWFEHEETTRQWGSEDISFARAIAGMLALRLAAPEWQDAADDPVPTVARDGGSVDRKKTAVERKTSPTTDAKSNARHSEPLHSADQIERIKAPKISFSERLSRQGLDRDSHKADVYEDVTVLALQFTDPVALAEYFGKDGQATTAVDHLVCHFEGLFETRLIDHWKIVGEKIVCAAGMAEKSNRSLHEIADLALSFQDTCSHLFAGLDKPMEFKIGIDKGGVIGSMIGKRQIGYNIWGEAVSIASMMADNGVAGAIQVSETAYRGLRQDYLFRVRGNFYLPNIGEISTYLLTGRL